VTNDAEPSERSESWESSEPEIPVVCSGCGTKTTVPFSAVEGAVAGHSERLHDGQAIAEVDPDVLEELADFVAADLGLLEE